MAASWGSVHGDIRVVVLGSGGGGGEGGEARGSSRGGGGGDGGGDGGGTRGASGRAPVHALQLSPVIGGGLGQGARRPATAAVAAAHHHHGRVRCQVRTGAVTLAVLHAALLLASVVTVQTASNSIDLDGTSRRRQCHHLPHPTRTRAHTAQPGNVR